MNQSLLGLTAILCCSSAIAATCEENFGTRGDPRNGVEFFTSADVSDISVASALGQLRSIAAADGFKVHAEKIDGSKGTLVIEQARGRPFLIHLSATDKGGGASEVGIQTRLNKGSTAQPEDMRANMCGMIARLKPGSEGESRATAARAGAAAAAKTIEVKAITLAREVDSVAKRQSPEIVTARFKGRVYKLDGTVKMPVEADGAVQLWYDTFNEGNVFMPTEIGSESIRSQIICVMATDQASEARRLKTGEFANLTGTVQRYVRYADHHGLELENCRFSH